MAAVKDKWMMNTTSYCQCLQPYHFDRHCYNQGDRWYKVLAGIRMYESVAVGPGYGCVACIKFLAHSSSTIRPLELKLTNWTLIPAWAFSYSDKTNTFTCNGLTKNDGYYWTACQTWVSSDQLINHGSAAPTQLSAHKQVYTVAVLSLTVCRQLTTYRSHPSLVEIAQGESSSRRMAHRM